MKWRFRAACALFAAAVTVTASPPVHAARHPASRLAGTVVWPPGMRPAPAFSLRDQNGRTVSRAALRGHVWAITFLDSYCRQACPVAARDLAHVQRLLGRHDPMVVVIVSVLPQYDTPSRVKAFARLAGLHGNWHWLLGAPRRLAPVWRAYGIQVITGIQHTAALYLVDRRGDVRVADAIPFVPSQLAGSVRALAQRPKS